ncbi:deoxynucleotidyltransferase terminal-interacting protein 2 [Pholidichthys leucotaenia]
MVVTRRGVIASTPSKRNPEQRSDVQATPSTAQKTRRAAKQSESPTQQVLVKTCSQLEKSEGGPPESPSNTTRKRCTRASGLHSPEWPSTPVGSVHEADVSDVESCCSAVSHTKPPLTRSRRKQRPAASRQDEEISEVESCSSALSIPKAGQSSRRSTKRKTASEKPLEENVKVELVLETESCSSVVSESQRVTRRTAYTRSSAKCQTEDPELSDAESSQELSGGVSGAEVSVSITRRATRSRRQMCPVPSEISQSPAPTGRQTRTTRKKAAISLDVSTPLSCDSDGFESGPTSSGTTRRGGKAQTATLKSVDSDSDATVGSSTSTRVRGTPSSSRTGSGSSSSSSRGALNARQPKRDFSVVAEKAEEPAEENMMFNDSKLESTDIAEDANNTLVEEEESPALGGPRDATNVEKEANIISEEDSPEIFSASVSKPAVMRKAQQEEPSAEIKGEDALEMERMQETVPSSEPSQLSPSGTITTCEGPSENTESEEKEAAVDSLSLQADEPLHESAAVENQPNVEEKMEVSTLTTDSQQVVETTQVMSNEYQKATVESDSEQKPEDVFVQKTKTTSLLDSSDDEDDDDDEEEEEMEVSGEKDSGFKLGEDRGEPPSKPKSQFASVKGLFMIDTRPGQDADEQYYKDGQWEEEAGTHKGEEQEEEDEEFVDEEGDDDEDDHDAKILYSSRDHHLKELSSRIDPGIRVKELGGLYISFDGSKSKPVSSSLQKLKEKKIQDEVMKKSVIGPDFEKKDAVPPYKESKEALKLKRRAEREKTTGDGWFNMKAPEVTTELKGDLQVLKMRGSLNPKRFYKKNDRDGFPKYFQVGTVVDSPVDFYHSRIPKKERKRTMVEELLGDAEFRQKNKKMYQKIIAERAAQGGGRRNKKKFHKK